MDMDHEAYRAKKVMAILILFVVGGYFAREEASYYLNGRETKGKITKISEVTTIRRGSKHVHLEVEFEFVEPNGTKRTGSDNVSTDWSPPPGKDPLIRYTPGADGRARLAGNVYWVGVAIFAGASCIILFFFLRLWLEARAATRELDRPQKTRRRRPRYDEDDEDEPQKKRRRPLRDEDDEPQKKPRRPLRDEDDEDDEPRRRVRR